MKNFFFQKPEGEEPVDPNGTGNTTPAADPPADGAAETSAQDAALNAEVARLEQVVAEHKDHLARRQAEFDNFRKRTEREKAEFRVRARMDAVESMLPVLDGLEAALKAPVGTGAEIRKGVELVEKQMREILEKMGMSRIDAQGKPFDPNLHHAVEMVQTDELPDHTVMDVYQQGYMFQDKLLRPAMVRVAVEPSGVESK